MCIKDSESQWKFNSENRSFSHQRYTQWRKEERILSFPHPWMCVKRDREWERKQAEMCVVKGELLMMMMMMIWDMRWSICAHDANTTLNCHKSGKKERKMSYSIRYCVTLSVEQMKWKQLSAYCLSWLSCVCVHIMLLLNSSRQWVILLLLHTLTHTHRLNLTRPFSFWGKTFLSLKNPESNAVAGRMGNIANKKLLVKVN